MIFLTLAEHQAVDLSEVTQDFELLRGKLAMAEAAVATQKRTIEQLETKLAAAAAGQPAAAPPAAAGTTPASTRTARRATPRSSSRKVPKPPVTERSSSPLSELQAMRRSLKPKREVVTTNEGDEVCKRLLIEQNRRLSAALLQSEAAGKRDREKANREIGRLQAALRALYREADGLRKDCSHEAKLSSAAAHASSKADNFQRLYKTEARLRAAVVCHARLAARCGAPNPRKQLFGCIPTSKHTASSKPPSLQALLCSYFPESACVG